MIASHLPQTCDACGNFPRQKNPVISNKYGSLCRDCVDRGIYYSSMTVAEIVRKKPVGKNGSPVGEADNEFDQRMSDSKE